MWDGWKGPTGSSETREETSAAQRAHGVDRAGSGGNRENRLVWVRITSGAGLPHYTR